MTKPKNKNNKIDPEILAHIAAADSHLRQNKKNNDTKLSNSKSDADAAISSLSLVRRHITKARAVAMRKTIRLPRSIRMQFCDNCSIPFVVGTNCTIRIRGGAVIAHCNACKHLQKFGGKRKTTLK